MPPIVGYFHMLLDLKYPVILETVSHLRINKTYGAISPSHESFDIDNPKAFGCYWFEDNHHVISIARDITPRGSSIWKDTVIHELVHAWQFENLGENFKRLHHGRRDYFLQWQNLLFNEYGVWI